MEIEQVKKAITPDEMRAELFRLSHHDPLVRSVMQSADYNGMSAEDRYTTLAYYAMLERNKFQQVLFQHALVDTRTVILEAIPRGR